MRSKIERITKIKEEERNQLYGRIRANILYVDCILQSNCT